MSTSLERLYITSLFLYFIRYNILAVYLRGGVWCPRYGCCCYKCRTLFPIPNLNSESLRDYMLFLAEGKGNVFENYVWPRNVTIHTINHERHVWYPSLSLEYKFHPRRIVYTSIMSFYVILVLTSHIWLAPIFPYTIGVCMPFNETSATCMITSDDIWSSLSSHHIDYSVIRRPPTSSQPLQQQYRDVVDDSLYVAYYTMEGSYKWLREPDLIHQLEEEERGDNNTCICPIFMGIIGNVTFLRHNDEWLIMHQPFIYRNNTMSHMRESSIVYHPHNRLYRNYNSFVSGPMRSSAKQRHYETLYVEYTSLEGETLYNDNKTKRALLFNIEPTGKTQKRITLTLRDAICFHFCDATNRLVLN